MEYIVIQLNGWPHGVPTEVLKTFVTMSDSGKRGVIHCCQLDECLLAEHVLNFLRFNKMALEHYEINLLSHTATYITYALQAQIAEQSEVEVWLENIRLTFRYLKPSNQIHKELLDFVYKQLQSPQAGCHTISFSHEEDGQKQTGQFQISVEISEEKRALTDKENKALESFSLECAEAPSEDFFDQDEGFDDSFNSMNLQLQEILLIEIVNNLSTIQVNLEPIARGVTPERALGAKTLLGYVSKLYGDMTLRLALNSKILNAKAMAGVFGSLSGICVVMQLALAKQLKYEIDLSEYCDVMYQFSILYKQKLTEEQSFDAVKFRAYRKKVSDYFMIFSSQKHDCEQ